MQCAKLRVWRGGGTAGVLPHNYKPCNQLLEIVTVSELILTLLINIRAAAEATIFSEAIITAR